jgi:TM2 domain-containing membrane protein YozV
MQSTPILPGILLNMPGVWLIGSLENPNRAASSLLQAAEFWNKIVYLALVVIIGGRWVMKTAIKAALLSALVFPGVGQMYLKRYVRGLIPMVLTLTGLGVWIAQATVGALQELEKMQTQGGFVDLNAVANRAVASSASGDWYSPLIVPMIVVCWLFSVIDAYMLGKGKEPPTDQDRAKGEQGI